MKFPLRIAGSGFRVFPAFCAEPPANDRDHDADGPDAPADLGGLAPDAR